MFDPYRKWLGIPESVRPPTHYQLLGISPDERDDEVIKAAVIRQSAYVRNFQTGKYQAEATRLLNEIGEAKVCLLDPAKRAQYDGTLRARSPARAISRPGPPAARLPVPPPRGAAPTAAPSSQPAARGTPPVQAGLEADPLWTALEHATAYGQPLGASTARLVPRRPRSPTPVWLWCIPLITGLVGAAMLLVFLTTNPTPPHVAPSDVEWRQHGPAPATEVGVVETDASVRALSRGGSTMPGTTPSFGRTVLDDVGRRGAALANGPPLGDVPSAASRPAEVGSAVTPRLTSPGAVEPNAADAQPFAATSPRLEATPSEGPSKARKHLNRAGSFGSRFDVAGSGWGDGPKLNIPLDRESGSPVFAQAGGPFVAVGEVVYSTSSGEPVGETGALFGTRPLKTLSADGKYFAIGDDDGIEVRKCEDASVVVKFQGKGAGVRLEFLSFGGPDRLLAVTMNQGSHYLQQWNLAAARISKDVLLETFDRLVALSADGKLLAMPVMGSGVLVYDIHRTPSKGKAKVAARIPITRRAERGLLMIDGLRFSPDGTELSAVCERCERLLTWDRNNRVVFEHAGGFNLQWARSFHHPESTIEWDPKDRGWLLQGGVFFDRGTRQVTWMIEDDFLRSSWDVPHRFVDGDRLAVCRTSGNGAELVDVQIPWQRIEQSLEAMSRDDTPAWISLHQPVSVQIKLGATFSRPAMEIEQDLQRLLTERLAIAGVSVSAGQPATVVVEYSERDRPARMVGAQGLARVVQVPAGNDATVMLTILLDHDPIPVWTAQFAISGHQNGAVSAASALSEQLTARLTQTVFPYFLPKQTELLGLPVLIRP